MAAVSTESTPACPYVIGDDGIARWPREHAEAWIGLLESHKRLTRELEAELVAEHGLTLSSLEVLGRLAAAQGRALGLSALAAETGLSLSRVSRILDGLEARALVERRSSPEDGRAKTAWLTDLGLDLLRAAQTSHFEAVQKRFFDQLGPGEVAVLAAVFGRFAPGGALERVPTSGPE